MAPGLGEKRAGALPSKKNNGHYGLGAVLRTFFKCIESTQQAGIIGPFGKRSRKVKKSAPGSSARKGQGQKRFNLILRMVVRKTEPALP